MTRASLTCLAAAWLAGLALTATVRAEDAIKEAPAKPRTFVILVGISKYADEQIKPRPHAEADVQALYDLVTNKDYLGADPKNVTLLMGSDDEKRGGKKATRAAVLKALKDVSKEANANDTVLMTFIGQGGPMGESGDRRCYFLADSTFKDRNTNALASEDVEEAFKSLKAKKVGVFLDVNFKGFVDDGKAGRAIAEPTLGKAPYREFLGDDNSEDHLPMPGRVAFLATNGLNQSLDLKDHGLFTTALLDALKGGADSDKDEAFREGYEADGLVTVDEVAKYLNKKIPELARANGKTDKEREQDHFVLAGPSAHFVLTHNPAASKKSTERLEKFEQMVKGNKVSADQAEEGRALLERMPLLKKRQELRKAYQGLVDGELKSAPFKAKRDEILESMKLNRTEAVAFARRVMAATEVITDEYVKDVNVGQMVTWAVRELYNFVEEKVPEGVEKQLKLAKGLNEKNLELLLADARLHLGQREDLENQKDLNVALQRMLQRLDPHTTYIDPETRKKFDADIAGNFTGIGIQIRKDANTDHLLVVTPIKGAPAYRVETPMSKADPKYPRGIWAGDIITTIVRDVDSKGDPLPKTETISTKGMALDKAVKTILGKPNTKVTVMVQREGIKEPFPVEIVRGKVDVESVVGATRKANDDWDFMIDRESKIGYLRLNSFSRTSARDLEAVVRELVRKEEIKGLVFDLRFNPGGLLDVAIKITDLFIDDGLVVSVHPRGGPERAQRFYGRHQDSLLNFPLVCLVNGYSASGSEIVSAALQDHKRAIIFGERSYGKGSVQNIRDFDIKDVKTGETLKAEIKLTTAAFRRPNGENLNKSSTGGKDEEKWGVVPDKVVTLSAKERRDLAEYQRNSETIERPDRRGTASTAAKKDFKDRQLEAALQYLRGQIKLSGKIPAKKAG